MSFDADRPFERSYWVVEGKLIAGCYPGSPDRIEMRDRMSRMLDLGIKHFVNLMEEDERDHRDNLFRPYDAPARELAKERGLPVSVSRFPIPDLGIPSRETMAKILDDIDGAVDAGRVAYVHCWGGRGRTGTVVGCWLARHGLARGKAILERIGELREVIPERVRGASPETTEQKEMATRWQG